AYSSALDVVAQQLVDAGGATDLALMASQVTAAASAGAERAAGSGKVVPGKPVPSAGAGATAVSAVLGPALARLLCRAGRKIDPYARLLFEVLFPIRPALFVSCLCSHT